MRQKAGDRGVLSGYGCLPAGLLPSCESCFWPEIVSWISDRIRYQLPRHCARLLLRSMVGNLAMRAGE